MGAVRRIYSSKRRDAGACHPISWHRFAAC
jgi:hypothetical protein